MDEIYQITHTLNDWELSPFVYITPTMIDVIPDSSQWVFSWDKVEPEEGSFGISIWNQDGVNLWFETDDTTWPYDGPVLSDGIYEYRIVSWDGDGQIHAKSQFTIGTP
jgi:hypothetical protein